MNRAITARQQEIVTWIRLFLAGHGYPPSIREIGEGVGLSSSSTVFNHLLVLQRKGYLVCDPHKSRALRLVEQQEGVPA